MNKELTQAEIDDCLADGWTMEQIEKGYDIFQCDGSEVVIDGALLIQTIDCVGKFYGDFEACRQAEKDGVKFINDIDGLEKGCYIDTPENREYCIKMLKEYPKYRVENLIINEDGSNNYWDKYKKYFNYKEEETC